MNATLAAFEPLLKIVCCPHTKAPLTLMSLSELEEATNSVEGIRIAEGTTGALFSAPVSRAYPILGEVVSFLDQDALDLFTNSPRSVLQASPTELAKLKVKEWYDEFGWKRGDDLLYGDTAVYSQIGNSAHGYYEMLSHLSLLNRFMGGEFLLDAASGAIAHPEYLAYSWFYKYRVCVDLSLSGLREATTKLGGSGYYCMADICKLPFRDNVFDAVVSGYTIQHIPDVDQRQAVTELHRVLAPRKICCIITGQNAGGKQRRVLLRILRLLGWFIKDREKITQSELEVVSHKTPAASREAPSALYYHARDNAWWKSILSELDCEFSLQALRLLTKAEFEGRYENWLSMARFLRTLEASAPHLLAPYSKYGLVEFRKSRDRIDSPGVSADRAV